jgi:PhzF family phenazine biosynthesis protein
MKILLYKAFTQDPAQGNPAGVVLDAQKLSSEQMQAIAAKLGFSESAFLNGRLLRYFSPTQEVDFCAHATLATVQALRDQDPSMQAGIITLETQAGSVPVEYSLDGRMMMTQKDPTFCECPHERKEVAALLNLSEHDIAQFPIQIVSTGVPKLIVPMTSLTVLFKIVPNLNEISEYGRRVGARGLYAFTFETQSPVADLHARQFNPLAGIPEDPITGIAAGALGAYLAKHQLFTRTQCVIEQGYIMNKGGRIDVDTSHGIRVGGYAVRYGEQHMEA